ncbi:ATP-binding cassette domain-containing protein, partial [Campylobacter jejuni]|nr:ATP-binding cassette domain-containing protein [Campylobacter jejuni]
MLKIHDLSFAYHQKDLLKNIHLELKNQAFIGILGPNGSGKSTLLKLILKNLNP